MSLEQRVSDLETDLAESEGRVLEAIADLKFEMRAGFADTRARFRVTAKALVAILDPREEILDQTRADLLEELQAYSADTKGGCNGART